MSVQGVGVNNVVTDLNGLRLIPNPNNGTFTINGAVNNSGGQVSVYVTNMLGQLVYKGDMPIVSGILNGRVALSNLASGTYMVRLTSGKEARVFKMVVDE